MLFLHPQLPHAKLRIGEQQELGLALHRAAQGALREIPGQDLGQAGLLMSFTAFVSRTHLLSHSQAVPVVLHPLSLSCALGAP